jgi:starch synthase
VQCNDWMTALVPAHVRTTYGSDPFWSRVGTLFTIHNMAFHGIFGPADIPKFGFSPDFFRTDGGFEFHGQASMMKAALLSADLVSTVSRKYAQEIQTPEFGYRLDGLLRARARDVVGILNGVDYEHWDPRHDEHIPAAYWADQMDGKLACKREMLSRFWLPDEPQRPVFGIVSRLSDQKGIDLIAESVVKLIETGAFFIELGSGSREYEEMFQALRDTYPRSVGVYRGYSEPLAHVIEAGSDFFLMPSRFEPSGLNQLYSLRYGTPPVVRATGGLDDTITHFDRASRTGNGFKFYEYRADRLLETIYEALLIYRQPELLAAVRRNGMLEDFSWDRSAAEYERVFARIAHRKHHGH